MAETIHEFFQCLLLEIMRLKELKDTVKMKKPMNIQ